MSEWQTFDTAPEDGSTILVADAFGVMWARFLPTPTFEEFIEICEEGGGYDEYLDWVEYLPHNCWSFGAFDNEEEVDTAYPTHWMPLPASPSAQ